MSVCAERAPWCYTGGLGDVTAALPGALRRRSAEVRYATLTPLYREARTVLEARGRALEDTGVTASATLGGHRWRGQVWRLADADAPDTFFLECDPLFASPGLYEMSPVVIDGESVTPDLAVRFAFLCEAAMQVGASLLGGAVDVFHLHDWHAAPLAWRLRQTPLARRPRVVLTIHNLAYQGYCASAALREWATPGEDGINFLRLGIEHADLITTVSPRYAEEIQTEGFGCGLHDLLRRRGVVGILNGVSDAVWDPATDPHLAQRFGPDDLDGRAASRAALAREAGWSPAEADLIVGVIARLDHQKGLDWVADVVPELGALGIRLVLLGTGDPALEARFAALAEAHPQRCAAFLAFDVPQSHRIIAGADAVLVPSRFEPCGLTQLYAMRYGAVPIVNAVGGLVDTVTDVHAKKADATGFVMTQSSAQGLLDALRRAGAMWHTEPARWRTLVHNGMAYDSTWDQSARAYLAHFAGDA